MRNPIFRSKNTNSGAQRLKNKKNETSFSEPPAASEKFWGLQRSSEWGREMGAAEAAAPISQAQTAEGSEKHCPPGKELRVVL